MHKDRINVLDDQISASVNQGRVLGIVAAMRALLELAGRCRKERDGDFSIAKEVIIRWLETLQLLAFPQQQLREWQAHLERLLR